jgi:hypothetical protein
MEFLWPLFVLALLSDMFKVVSAFDSDICCLKSARNNLTSGLLPWDSCAFGADYNGTYGLGEVPQVTATLGFCKEHCPGIQLSTVDEWLGLLTSWVLPAFALLLICPTGGGRRIGAALWELAALLGDPVSAIRGAFSEVVLNVRMMHDNHNQNTFDRLMRVLVVVAGQTLFDMGVDIKLTNGLLRAGLLVAIDPFKKPSEMEDLRKALNDWDPEHKADNDHIHAPGQNLEQQLIDKMHVAAKKLRRILIAEKLEESKLRDGLLALHDYLKALQDSRFQGDQKNVQRLQEVAKVLALRLGEIYSEGGGADVKEGLFEQSEWVVGIKIGILVVLKGEIDFMKGVFLPVVLGLVATAASFYGAYTDLGDNDTAHALAYGVWYSWIIILAVVSNSFTATANPGLAKLALEGKVFLSDVTVSLRKRSDNAEKWRRWLKDIGCEEDGDTGSISDDNSCEKGGNIVTTSPRQRSSRSWAWLSLKLLFKQTLAWLCVAIPCGCAATISYTTPTVGLGCRSFSHLLYGICTLLLSWFSVYRSQVGNTYILSRRPNFLGVLYGIGVLVNFFILVGSTMFHLIGVFRNCRCNVLFVSDDFLLQMSSNTALDVANAKKFWLPVGYIDFGFIWIVCTIAVACQLYMHYITRPTGS